MNPNVPLREIHREHSELLGVSPENLILYWNGVEITTDEFLDKTLHDLVGNQTFTTF